MSENILIIGPAWVGDMVMAQVLFKVLKRTRPDCNIDVIAPRSTLPLLERMPEVREGIVIPLGHGDLALRKRYQQGKQLRDKNYSQAIILPNSFKSAIIPWAAKIPKVTGWQRELRSIIVNDCRNLNKQKYPLMIERFMALAFDKSAELTKPYPYPSFSVNQDDINKALAKMGLEAPKDSSQIKSKDNHDCQSDSNGGQPASGTAKIQNSEVGKVLALCPGAEFGASKRWPEYHYAEVAREKIAAGWNVWLFGGPNDKDVCEQIISLVREGLENFQIAEGDIHNKELHDKNDILGEKSMGCRGKIVNLAGKTNLGEAIDLLSLASAVVSNDSGLMHVAAALDKPMVAVYGSSSPEFTPPLSDKAKMQTLNLECSPCFKRECPLQHHNCMIQLMPEQVLYTLKAMGC